MRRQGMKRGLAAILAAAMVLGGCGGGQSAGGSGGGQQAAGGGSQTEAGGTAGTVADSVITLGDGVDIKHMDPQETDDIYSMFLLKHLYNKLFKLGENNEILCDLAESYDVEDELTYHIVLDRKSVV